MKKTIYTDEYDVIIEALIEARHKVGITQKQLSAELEKPNSFVCKYETKIRRLDALEVLLISKKLGYNPLPLLKSVYNSIRI